MPTAKFMEAGTTATFNLDLWTATSAGASSSTATLHDLSHSLKLDLAGSVRKAGVCQDTGCRISLYVRFDGLPGSPTKFLQMLDASVTQTFGLRITAAGVLQLEDHNGNQFGTDGFTFSTNTFYRVCVAWTAAGVDTNEFRVYVNGTLSISVTNGHVQVGSDGFQLLDPNTTAWYCCIYCDTDSSLADPGDIRVTAKRPFANGTTNGFTTQIGVSGSGYGSGHSPQVNERPSDQSNGWSMIGAGSAVTEEYTIEGQSVGDINLTTNTIVESLGWIFASALAGETATLIVGGTTGNAALTSTPTPFMRGIGSTTYPGGGDGIGLTTTTLVTTVSLYDCGVMVAYLLGGGSVPPLSWSASPVVSASTPVSIIASGFSPPSRPG